MVSAADTVLLIPHQATKNINVRFSEIQGGVSIMGRGDFESSGGLNLMGELKNLEADATPKEAILRVHGVMPWLILSSN